VSAWHSHPPGHCESRVAELRPDSLAGRLSTRLSPRRSPAGRPTPVPRR
jgi:hypothetical protein